MLDNLNVGIMTHIVTGAAGFVGFYSSKMLLDAGCRVIGVDNLNDYYDVNLKRMRLGMLKQYTGFTFIKGDISDKEFVFQIFSEHRPDVVINLAAQAGVRYSLVNPDAYIRSNIIGFYNILEACRNYPVRHLLFASSSSVYGGNRITPFSTSSNVDHPVSLYAATKKSNEIMAHSYSHLYGIPVTGLRFFTVYGPWGRPDMAYFSFTRNIINGLPIRLFNYGNMERDFTYIDDVVHAIYKLISLVPEPDNEWDELHSSPASSFAPYRIYNIGNNHPIKLTEFIAILEEKIGKKAIVEYTNMQPGDVLRTCADITDLERSTGFRPCTSIDEGLGRFIEWYKEYYHVKG